MHSERKRTPVFRERYARTVGRHAMPLECKRISGRRNIYLRGTVRGVSIFETTGTDDEDAAEKIRIRREGRLLDDTIFGKKATATFAEATHSYLAGGGSRRFLGKQDTGGRWTGLIGHFYNRPLHTIGQDDLDTAARSLYPRASGETRNRQCYTPFIAVWNHAVGNQTAELRLW